MRVVSALAVLFALFALVSASAARAHQATAEAPLFERVECVQRVDLREVGELALSYQVPYDDTALMMGDIDLPDAKTHQFFAFAGTLIADGFAQDFHAFDADGPAVRVPTWITIDDVKRAAQASGSLDATGFSASDVPAGTVLDELPELRRRYLRITEDDARVPITQAQAAKGVRWALAGVPAGVYTLAGYVFSPPYNGWAVRTAKVKIVDAELDPPVLEVEPLRSSLFASQGLRVRACLDVPEGTELRAAFTIGERPELGYLPWLDARPASSGELQLCFHNPRPDLTGSVQLRFELRAKDGRRWLYYAPDPITALPGGAACVEAGNVCCDFPHDPVVVEPPAALDAGLGAASPGGAGAGAAAAAAAAPDAGPQPAADPEPASTPRGSSTGCAAAPERSGALGTYTAWLVSLVAFGLRARRPTRTARRSRAHRRRPSRSAH